VTASGSFVPGGKRRSPCRICLDWSEWHDHLAGVPGSALLGRFEKLGWASQEWDSRVVAFSAAGEGHFREWLAGPPLRLALAV
jgi:hypothetical protein